MKTKTLKHISYYLGVALLTAGASLTIGLLSFGGMFSLWPVWSLALGTVALSASYEGQIYIDNIKSAINKLFLTPNYLKNHLANDFLKNHFMTKDIAGQPQFFKEYEEELVLLHEFKNKKLKKHEKQRQKNIEKNILDRERWFAHLLFIKRAQRKNEALNSLDYAKELYTWLDTHRAQEVKETQYTYIRRRRLFYAVGAFSVLCAGFMTIGTTYLLSETLLVIPFLTALSTTIPPAGFIILASLAGTAYGLLIYNAVTDMINNETLQNLFKRFAQVWKNGLTPRNVIMTALTVALVMLAIALTVCTAGTWWTVARETSSLLPGLMKLPSFIMKFINPILIGIASLFFNWQNTAETLELLEEVKKSPLRWLKEYFAEFKKLLTDLLVRENWLQILNPARLILKITLLPLRIFLFIGHLASIAVTGDRMPGVPQIISSLFGFISEGFEDAHYFFGQLSATTKTKPTISEMLNERLNPQTQRIDFPTQILKNVIFKPVYWLAAAWDWAASKLNPLSENNNGRRRLSYSEAVMKQSGQINHENETDQAPILIPEKKSTLGWEKELLVMQIEQFKQEHFGMTLFGRKLVKDKIDCLTQLQVQLKQVKSTDVEELKQIITAANDLEINGVRCLQVHRHFHFFGSGSQQPKLKTASQTLLANLTTELNELTSQSVNV